MSDFNKVQFPTNKRLALTTGHVYLFAAGVPRTLPPKHAKLARAAGALDGSLDLSSVRDEQAVEGGDENLRPSITRIVETVREIIESGDSEKLTSGGKVTVEALENALEAEVSAAERDRAHEIIEAAED